jgi:WhiB family redox-sensing transcriptional regulator
LQTLNRAIETDIDVVEYREWRNEAECRDTDPDLFFPVGTTGAALDQIEAAKAICANCVVRAECLEYALVTNQESGIWGGTSEEERRKLRKSWMAKQRRSA